MLAEISLYVVKNVVVLFAKVHGDRPATFLIGFNANIGLFLPVHDESIVYLVEHFKLIERGLG